MVNRRKAPRMRIRRSVYVSDDSDGLMSAESIDISPVGLKIRTGQDLKTESLININLNLHPHAREAKLRGQVRWKRFIEKDEYQYGIQFIDKSDINLSEVLNSITKEEVEKFFDTKLPAHIEEGLRGHYVYKKADQTEIMNTIDFTPPFLRIEKIIVFGDETEILKGYSIGRGFVSSEDTEGHYNKSIYLAMCGWLMASSASIHVNMLYPHTAPQVVKADGVMPLHLSSKKGKLWQPSVEGTEFWIETKIQKKKMHMVLSETKISFDFFLYGIIKELRLILTPKNIIWTAQRLPSCVQSKG